MVEVISGAHASVVNTARELKNQLSSVRACTAALSTSEVNAAQAKSQAEGLAAELAQANGEVEALEKHETYRAAGRLSDLERAGQAQRQAADAAAQAMLTVARSAAAAFDSLQRSSTTLLKI